MNISISLRFLGVTASGFSRFAGSSKCFLCSSSRLLQDVLPSTDPHGLPQTDIFSSSGAGPLVGYQNLPLMTSRPLLFPSRGKPEKQAWLETLSVKDNEKLGIVNLHPDIFATYPRIDILWWNVHWQAIYRKINYEKVKNRAEMRGGGRKPWPQKGSGRARHGSIRSPLWHGGGKSFGPRGPKSFFFMLPIHIRVLGLRVALSVKYAQDNLHIVDSLDLPSDEPSYLRDTVESRGWGLSVLFVDDTDIVSRNMALATDKIKEYNVMPAYGLNVHSMLKHETLVLTLAAVERIEEKILQQMHNQEHKAKKFRRSST